MAKEWLIHRLLPIILDIVDDKRTIMEHFYKPCYFHNICLGKERDKTSFLWRFSKTYFSYKFSAKSFREERAEDWPDSLASSR